jgi:hypothetical protein
MLAALRTQQLPATQPNGTGDRQHLVKKARHNPLKITLVIFRNKWRCFFSAICHPVAVKLLRPSLQRCNSDK